MDQKASSFKNLEIISQNLVINKYFKILINMILDCGLNIFNIFFKLLKIHNLSKQTITKLKIIHMDNQL